MPNAKNKKTSLPGERIAKVIARAGLCSRRDAEAWIAEGRVSVNGARLTSPATNVTDQDTIQVDGKPLPERERTRLWLYHKPKDLLVARRDPKGRPTIFSKLPKDMPRVSAVGRLDYTTEGLLLLTNDGGLKRILELPETGWLRRYRVRVHGQVAQDALNSLVDGIEIDGVQYGPVEAILERQQGSNAWITMGLREGKNREVKILLGHLGLTVTRLIRVSYGPFQLGELRRGEALEVRTRVLRDQLGGRLIKASSADFDAPIRAAARRKPAGNTKPAAKSKDPNAPRKVHQRRKPGQIVGTDPKAIARPKRRRKPQ